MDIEWHTWRHSEHYLIVLGNDFGGVRLLISRPYMQELSRHDGGDQQDDVNRYPFVSSLGPERRSALYRFMKLRANDNFSQLTVSEVEYHAICEAVIQIAASLPMFDNRAASAAAP